MNKATDAKNKDTGTTSEPLSQPMTYGIDAYVSEDYLRLERDKVWRKVWLQAGRVEEIPNVGDYLTYEILDDSILIVRTATDKINAYHNVCQHRGRRLVDTPKGEKNACGTAKQFVCGFHGWRWNLEGENIYVLDKDDWQGALTDERIKLKQVKVDTWGGWIWISMNPDVEPLREYLEPVVSLLAPFHLENQRFRWRKWAIFDCNWKVAVEAFNEAYHVQGTHPEFMVFGQFTGSARVQGKHSQTMYDSAGDGNKTKIRLGKGDPRTSTAEMQQYTWDHTAGTTTTWTLVETAQRLKDELPEGTPADQVLKYWVDTARKTDAARGAVWPTVDPDAYQKSGNAWQIFPNFQIGHALNNALCYQARPYGNDPNKCIFEMTVFELFPPGEEPKAAWVHTPIDDPSWLSVLPQDFNNMAAVQQGMKSLGFAGPRPNPKQERAVTALHRTLAQYMGTEAPRPLE